MKPEWRRYAPWGLYLAGLAAVVSIGLYIIQREWNIYLQISLALIVLGLAAFAFLDPEKVRLALTGRQARYGSNALVLSIAFIGILVVVNYIAYANSQRWDLTEEKQYTLAPETIYALQNLQEPVLARAFFTKRLSTDQAKGLLDQYQFQSKGKFSYEFIDPESKPLVAQEAKVTRDGTVVLSLGKLQQTVTLVSEEELTGALVRLINPETRVVYFLTGHGERSPDNSGEQGLSQIKSVLENKNYVVKTLSLLDAKQLPVDAKIIVIDGPRKPVSENEVQLLDGFLAKGGAVLVMEEPIPLSDFGDAPDPLADYLANTWGLKMGNDLVVDLSSNQVSVAVGIPSKDHAITSKMSGLYIIMPTARSITISQGSTGVTQAPLVTTSQQSWAETDVAALKDPSISVSFNEGKDTPGPVTIGAVAENLEKKSRLVVFGDADYISNANYQAYGNADLFTNSIDWSAGQESLINLTPKKNVQRLLVPPQRITMNLLFFATVIVIPGLTLLAGVITWIQRMRRG